MFASDMGRSLNTYEHILSTGTIELDLDKHVSTSNQSLLKGAFSCYNFSSKEKKMSQEPFIYSFVARGTMILAEYTEFTGNFPAIAAQCLQRLPSSNNKFTYNCDHHTFNFLVEDGYAYCVVAKDSVGKQISIAFLERMKADFKKRYGGGKADTAIAKSLNKEFGPIMKEHMKYIIEHAEEIEKLLKVKAQVSEVKSIMLENIDKVSASTVVSCALAFLTFSGSLDMVGAMVHY
ncbi:Longin domain - like 3 [Theobroma cacao]|nr:Longin domain - like 3 [Theobroma cacao]